MSELGDTVREALAELARSDPQHRRFGAAAHRYALAPPRDDVPELPDDLAAFARDVGSGGAGPGYGWISVERAVAAALPAPAGAPWTRGLPIAHLGCGYAAIVVLDGAHRGEVWCDARSIDVVAPIAPSFPAYYLAWIDQLAYNAWPTAHAPPGRCALSAVLSGYLGAVEQRLGLAAGTIEGEPLREALADLPAGGIQLAAQADGLFAIGDRVDPCLTCARLVDTLAADGLPRDVIAPGTEMKSDLFSAHRAQLGRFPDISSPVRRLDVVHVTRSK